MERRERGEEDKREGVRRAEQGRASRDGQKRGDEGRGDEGDECGSGNSMGESRAARRRTSRIDVARRHP